MSINPAIISSVSALLGALTGGGASLAAAIYTQRYQDRLQRTARESTKRETVYAEFIMSASAALLSAYVADQLTLGRDQQQLVGVLQRMRLFAPSHVVQMAEGVLQFILKIALQPPVNLRCVTPDDLAQTMEPNALDAFSKVCRTDLDELHHRIA